MKNEQLEPGHHVPGWLKQLQENSWELELLISGGAIFSLFQINTAFVDWMASLNVLTRIPGTAIITFIGVAVIWTLTIGFSVHLLSRAYWLALVCINYVFPTGVSDTKIKPFRPFKPLAQKGDDLQRQIVQVDRFCGLVIYSTITGAVVIFGLLLGFTPILLWEMLLGNTQHFSQVNDAVSNLFILSYALYVVDFLLRGLFRKASYLSYAIFPFFYFYDHVTLRRLYARSLYLLNSNTRYLHQLLAATSVLLLVFTCTYLTLFRRMHWPNVFDERELKWQLAEGPYLSSKMYRDQVAPDGVYHAVSIQSKFVQKGYVELFLRYERKADFIKAQVHGADTSVYFSDLWAVNIDGRPIDSVSWHPTWNSSVDNIGITGIIRIDTLSIGEHYVQVSLKDYVVTDGHDLGEKYEVTIPFWRDMYN
jgi:hypothetical protein